MSGPPQRNPFVFVVGCPRSGTTLLQRMLDHHPLLAVANDTHFIPRALERAAPELYESIERGASPRLTPELVEAVLSYHRFGRLGVGSGDARAAAAGARDFADFVARLYTIFARGRGKALGGEKTPDYVRRLPLLAGLFPEARVVHIVRDGRDVALSLLEWANERKGPGRLELWRRDRVAACALWWRWQVLSGRSAAERGASGPYREVRYEALVDRPGREIAALCEFLGLPMSPATLEFHRGRTTDVAGRSAKSNWLPPTAGLRDWRTQMAPERVELFEALAGDLLGSSGYELSGRTPGPEAHRRAAEARTWWEGFADHRRRKLRRRIARRLAAAGPERVSP